MKSTGSFSIDWWCPEHWAPQHRRIGLALICSLLLHVLLMAAGNGGGDLNRNTLAVVPMFSASSQAAPFLVVSLPQDRRLGDPVQEDVRPQLGHEPLRAENTANVRPDRPAGGKSDFPDGSRSTNASSRAVQSQEVTDRNSEAAAAGRVAAEEAANRLRREAYMRTALLDVPPQLLQDIQPVYPVAAGNQEGAVVLRLFISERGEVDELLVARASPRGFFEEAALAAFAPARFSPGVKNGNAVKSQLAVEVQFVPYNRGADVSGRGY